MSAHPLRRHRWRAVASGVTHRVNSGGAVVTAILLACDRRCGALGVRTLPGDWTPQELYRALGVAGLLNDPEKEAAR